VVSASILGRNTSKESDEVWSIEGSPHVLAQAKLYWSEKLVSENTRQHKLQTVPLPAFTDTLTFLIAYLYIYLNVLSCSLVNFNLVPFTSGHGGHQNSAPPNSRPILMGAIANDSYRPTNVWLTCDFKHANRRSFMPQSHEPDNCHLVTNSVCSRLTAVSWIDRMSFVARSRCIPYPQVRGVFGPS
jgi:hypothetical protein